MWKGYDDKIVKDICYNCGSASARQSYNYFCRANYRAGQKNSTVWCKVYLSDDGVPKGFFYAYKCRTHVRLIEIAVRNEYKGHGIGRMLLFDLLSAMKRAGLYKLTFRTPIDEEAQNFWLHVGATITGLKDNDYEMEINIKQE